MISPKISDGEFTEGTLNWSRAYVGANNKYPIMEIEERLREVEKRLLIVDPSTESLSKYPALAEAYREYKIIEKLVLGENNEASK